MSEMSRRTVRTAKSIQAKLEKHSSEQILESSSPGEIDLDEDLKTKTDHACEKHIKRLVMTKRLTHCVRS